MDAVECSECGGRYDSDENPFCPRCGSLSEERTVPAAAEAARRLDPRRRRVRMAGVMLLLMGGVAAIPLAMMLVAPPDMAGADLDALAETDFMSSRAGGTASFRIVDGEEPVPGANITVRHWNGTAALHGSTDGNGSWSAMLPGTFSNVTVSDGSDTWTRMLFVPDGGTVEVVVDRAAAPAGVEWVAYENDALMRGFSAVLLAAALVIVAGGVAALRLRAYGLAFSGGLVAVLGTLLFMVAFVNLLMFLNAALAGLALAFVVRGRRYFGGA